MNSFASFSTIAKIWTFEQKTVQLRSVWKSHFSNVLAIEWVIKMVAGVICLVLFLHIAKRFGQQPLVTSQWSCYITIITTTATAATTTTTSTKNHSRLSHLIEQQKKMRNWTVGSKLYCWEFVLAWAVHGARLIPFLRQSHDYRLLST